MIPLTRPFFGAEETEAVGEVLASGWVAQGPKTRELEAELATVVGARHGVAASSATTALHLAVVATGIARGDEVILPSFTFPATANAVLYEGATPVFVDVEAATLNMDVRAVEAAITKRTRAIIGVHLFGWPCEMDALRELCDGREIVLIEDAACGIGTELDGRQAGSLGDVACFSFHGRKVLTCGEGGMLTTSDDALAESLRSLRTHGADAGAHAREAHGVPRAAEYVRLGYNYRLSDVQAAIARVQLRRLELFLRERNEIARRYDEALRELPGLRLPPRRAGRVHSYQSYVIVLERSAPIEPDRLRASLAERNISTQIGTYAVHRQPYLPESCRPQGPLPVTEEAAERSVAIPMFNGLGQDDQERVIEGIRGAWRAG